MLDQITPIILTMSEEANIARLLDSLTWAQRVIIVDSGSTDATLAIAGRYPNVDIFHRPFDNHWNQWRFAVEDTDVATDWVLRLDADYSVSAALLAELAALRPAPDLAAYRVGFDYAIWGQRLPTSLYPANVVLFRRGRMRVVESGHTERWEPAGREQPLSARLVHDDRKSIETFMASQLRYMRHEARVLTGGRAGAAAWLRRHPPLMPIATFLYCLFGKGLIFGGRAGWFYTLQRTVAEAVLAMIVLEEVLRERVGRSARQ